MPQLSDDAFAFGSGLMPVDDAAALVASRVPAISETRRVPTAQADNCVLAAPLIAAIDLPPFDNSAVDGYAVGFSHLAAQGPTDLPVGARIAAGHGAGASNPEGHAARIFTGAPMPAGLDTVFMQEDVETLADGRLRLPAGLRRGANMRPRGEDIRKDEVAIEAGRRLTPRDIALAAALGEAALSVKRPLRVAVFSTGDEISEPGKPLRPATLYDSNRFALQALLRRQGCEVSDLGILPDDRQQTQARLAKAASGHDLVLTSGGVSTGAEDHVRAAIEGAGALVFWRLAIKPGRPVAMGIIEGTPFIGLPGNPVAVFVTFAFVVRPLIAALLGEKRDALLPSRVVSAFAYKKKKGRREYVRVSLKRSEPGLAAAHKYPVDGAGILTSLTRTDGLVQLGEDVTQIAPGDRVDFIGYEALL